jgi:DNA-binding NtrC family response regulator
MQAQTVLLVDDDAALRAALLRALRRERYRIVVASRGPEALALLRRCRVDVIVCDEAMPGMLGTELLQRIRSEHRDIVPILLTGYGTIEVAQRAVNEGGVFRLLSKPCHPEALARAIHEALEASRLTQHVRSLMRDATRAQPCPAGFEESGDGTAAAGQGVIFEIADEPVDLNELVDELISGHEGGTILTD